MRPRQWVKNLFVLAPTFFSQNVLVLPAALRGLGALGAFCMLSSSVYVLNDWRDREQDRLHPVKKGRPIAAGEIGTGLAIGLALGLLVGGLLAGAFIHPLLGLVLLAYWATNVLYSITLKHQVILDVFALASGYVLRVVGGGVAVDVPLSPWLLLCTMLLALFLGFCKRRHELVLFGDSAETRRAVLVKYSPLFLDTMIAVVTACTLMSYALYTMSEETIRIHSRGLFFTLPFVLYGIFRYLYVVYQKSVGGDPTQDLLADRPTVVNFILWVLTAGLVIYWR